MANTAIGEAAIYHDGAEYLLRPSFSAMQQIGTPDDIEQAALDVYNALCKCLSAEPLARHEIAPCAFVLHCCAVTDLPPELVGQVNDDLSWQFGAMSTIDLCTIAHQMVSYGINGKPDKDRLAFAARQAAKEGATGGKFDPLEYIGSAVAHLGLSTADAWALTMVEFQRAIDAKFPLDKKHKNQLTKEELRAAMAL